MIPAEARRSRLSPAEPLAPPAWLQTVNGDDLVGLREAVDRDGAGALSNGRTLTADELLAIGAQWGEPLVEHAPEVQRFVEHGCVLNIVAEWDGTADVDRQPFSTAPILLHSEGSRRPVADQPRYLVFVCVEPPDAREGGQTVIVRMDDVAARLPSGAADVLRSVRYRGDGMPPLLRTDDRGNDVFSFRDFGDEALELSGHADDADADVEGGEVDAAVAALLDAMYEPAAMTGLSWSRDLLVVLDNHRLFHGRTAMRDDLAGAGGRWLRRVRVRAPVAAEG